MLTEHIQMKNGIEIGITFLKLKQLIKSRGDEDTA